MPPYGGMGRAFAAEDEESMRRKLRQLTSDPLASVRSDPEFLAFKSDQFRRVYPGAQEYDATGRAIDPTPLVTAIEPFRPKVKRDDLAFSAPVGTNGANKFSDLLGAKRALSNTGLFDFDVTRERSDHAGPAFTDVVKAFQRNRGLKVDGLMNPDGPTVKSLRGLLFPQGSTSNVGKPVNLLENEAPGKVQETSSLRYGLEGKNELAAGDLSTTDHAANRIAWRDVDSANEPGTAPGPVADQAPSVPEFEIEAPIPLGKDEEVVRLNGKIASRRNALEQERSNWAAENDPNRKTELSNDVLWHMIFLIRDIYDMSQIFDRAERLPSIRSLTQEMLRQADAFQAGKNPDIAPLLDRFDDEVEQLKKGLLGRKA